MLPYQPELDLSLAYLRSPEALRSLERDPYWPKWDTPWWHMVLLHELGHARLIPRESLQKMVDVLKTHYLPFFPLKVEDVPVGADPRRQIACHCAVGSIYQTLFAAGVDVDRELPWMRPWILKHQMADGGLNCDESAYTKPVPKSSIMSTVPCLEAILYSRDRDLTSAETAFLEKGAAYLLRQRLFRRQSTGDVIAPEWLEARFPRFYDYDFLRGYVFLKRWSAISGERLPDELVDEVAELAAKHESPEGFRLLRHNGVDSYSYNPEPNGEWKGGTSAEFPLMERVSQPGLVSESYARQWNETRPLRAEVTEDYAIAYPNPLRLKKDDRVTIEKRETNPDWLGWVFCRASDGNAGWISEMDLDESGSTAAMKRDYDARELAVKAGDKVRVYYDEFGWAWCRDSHGDRGWLPLKSLRLEGRGAI